MVEMDIVEIIKAYECLKSHGIIHALDGSCKVPLDIKRACVVDGNREHVMEETILKESLGLMQQ